MELITFHVCRSRTQSNVKLSELAKNKEIRDNIFDAMKEDYPIGLPVSFHKQ